MLNSPKSVEFKGESELSAESLSDVLSATLGYSIDGLQSFDGLYMNDPFNTAKSVVSVVVEGVDSLNFQVCLKILQSFVIIRIIFFSHRRVIAEFKVIQHCWGRIELRGCFA